MAYFVNAATYANTELNDTLSGSPDYWTDSGLIVHTYPAGSLHWVKSGAGIMFSSVGSIPATQRYYRFTWKYTVDNNSTPIIFATVDAGNTVVGVGMYMDFPTDTLFARNGAGYTSTGVTLAINTTQQVEYVVNRTTGTYKLYFNGTLNNTYNIDTNTDAAFSNMSLGGGTSAATYTADISDVFLAKDTLASAHNLTLLGVGV